MAEPLEELALQAVVQLLEGMVGVRPWGGSYPNPPRVVRRLPLSIEAIGQTPLIAVALRPDGSEYRLGEDEDMVTVGGAVGYRHTFAFDVVGYVSGTGEAGPDTWCLRLRKDILDTLCARRAAIPSVSQARSLWPFGGCEFDPGVLGDSLRAFRQGYAVDFDEVMTLI